jgi:hypothetical protein
VIRPLRRTHWRFVLLLAVIVPLILVAALTMRADRPVQHEWPFEVRR